MNCRRARPMFGKFLDQGLGAKQARLLVAHLDSCPECARAWTQFRGSLGALKNLDRIKPSPDFEAGIWQRIRESEQKPGWQGSWRTAASVALFAMWPKIAGAAAVASIAFGALMLGGVFSRGADSDIPAIAVDTESSRPVRTFQIPDDRVWADAVSSNREVAGRSRVAWPRSGRLERDFPLAGGFGDTVGTEPEFVIRRVSYDPTAPPSRAF